jgi:hypothetical protein
MLGYNFELFCKLYLDSDYNRDEILMDIKEIIGGEIGRFSSLANDNCNLDVLRNDDFQENRRNEHPDGFLFSRYLIELEPNENVSAETYITTVSRLLEGLWNRGYKAVASCDFEELLPNKGGFPITD